MFYIIKFINLFFLVCHFLAKISIMVHPLLSRTWSCSSCAVTLDVVATFVVNVRVVGVWGNGVNSTNPAGRFSVCSRLACATASVDQLSNPLMRFFSRGRLEGSRIYTRINECDLVDFRPVQICLRAASVVLHTVVGIEERDEGIRWIV